jgi:large subunit ribosomal protein L35
VRRAEREVFVPKLKSHRGAVKRFKKTGTGKIMRHHASARHILTSKTRKRKRKLRKQAEVSPGESKSIERMLL